MDINQIRGQRERELAQLRNRGQNRGGTGSSPLRTQGSRSPQRSDIRSDATYSRKNDSYSGQAARLNSRINMTTAPHMNPSNSKQKLYEEEQYERRRQEELRYAIKMKEKELESLQNNKDRMRRREDFQLNSQINKEQDNFASKYLAKEQSNSPLRSKSPTQVQRNFYNQQQPMNQANQPLRTSPPRSTMQQNSSAKDFRQLPPSTDKQGPTSPLRQNSSKSPYRQSFANSSNGATSYMPTREVNTIPTRQVIEPQPSQTVINHDVTPSYPRDQLHQIQNDNASLQRRLNLVLQELERVQKEKTHLHQKLNMTEQETSKVQRLLDDEQGPDQINAENKRDLQIQQDTNHDLKKRIQQLQFETSDFNQKFLNIQGDRSMKMVSKEDAKGQLDSKVRFMQDLQREQQAIRQRMNVNQVEIEQLEKQERVEAHQRHDIQLVIDRLIAERDDLMHKLDKLNYTYETCVNEISKERASIDQHNKQHIKLLVAKILYQTLDQAFTTRKQAAFNEFINYCDFDEKCHMTLRNFALVLERIGHFHMKIAIKKWHQKAYKPLQMIDQSRRLTVRSYEKRLVQNMFYKWLKMYQGRVHGYTTKNNALEKIWNIKVRDCGMETARAFKIWRDKLMAFKLQKMRVKKLVYKAYFAKLNGAFNKLNRNRTDLDFQVRMAIVAREFAERQLKTITLGQLRLVTCEMRRKRRNRLFHVIKAWKDHIRYRKHSMAANMAMVKFSQTNTQFILKQCFDALKVHKEKEKLFCMQEALEGDCNPAMENLSKDVSRIKNVAVRSEVKRRSNTIARLLYTRIGEYFQYWKSHTHGFSHAMNSRIKDHILRQYKVMLRTAFETWRKGNKHKEQHEQKMTMMVMQEEGSNLQAQVDDLNKDIAIQKAKVDRSSRSSNTRAVKICYRRYLKQAMDKWRECLHKAHGQENAADRILQRIRKRMCKQAFNLYKQKVALCKQEDKHDNRCDYIISTFNERIKRRIFNAMCVHQHNHRKGKKAISMLNTKMKVWLLKRAMKTWHQQGHQKMEETLFEEQSFQTQAVDEVNEKLGVIEKKQMVQSGRTMALKDQLSRQAKRVVSNAFARTYYTGTRRGFETWRKWIEHEKHKQKLLKRTLDHWKRHQFNFAKAAIRNWMLMCDIDTRRAELNHKHIEVDEAIQLNNHNKANAIARNNDLTEQLQNVMEDQRILNHRFGSTLGLLINKNDKCIFQGNLRYIFQQWAAFVKRQKHFALTLEKVMSKAMWERGLRGIKNMEKNNQYAKKVDRSLTRIRRKFWQHTVGSAFHLWREQQFEHCKMQIESFNQTINNSNQQHYDKKVAIQNKNLDRSERIVLRNKKMNIFQSWKNVINWMKMNNGRQANLNQAYQAKKARHMILKWKARKDATLIARQRYEALRVKFDRIRLLMVYRALAGKYDREKAFCYKLKNLAYKFDQKNKQASFHMIQSFVRAKDTVYETRKKHARNNIYNIFQNLVDRRMQGYFSDLKHKTQSDHWRMKKQYNTIVTQANNRMREYFHHWRAQALKKTCVIENNETGPLCEEVFDYQQDLYNLKNFMRDEGYKELQIDHAENKVSGKNRTQMARAVARIKHQDGDDNWLKPVAFDRWVYWVKMRKLTRHWLQYLENRQDHVRSDLAQAFDKWKYTRVANRREEVEKMEYEQLKERKVHLDEILKNKVQDDDYDEDLLNQLSAQNDELFEKYLKSQKLAIIKAKHRREWDLKKALTRWKRVLRREDIENKKKELEATVAEIGARKNRIADIEADNDELARENEELRQFSLDGYQIAKNVQNLTAERENLSVDLADKAKTIKELLLENERLNNLLKQEQESAMLLLQKTNGSMNRY